MEKSHLKKMLREKVLMFDGAMGTMLQKMGLKTSQCPEIYNLENKEVIKSIHKGYIEAGCDIIQTNTFGGNRIKLSQYGFGDKVEEINRQAVALAKETAKEGNLVAGDIGPIGKLLYPLGELTFEEAYEIFFQQAKALIEAGADLINIETMSDIKEAKAAVMAVKDIADIPIVCSMTFQENMRTLTGSDPKTVVTVLEALGVDVIGANCGFGPDMMIKILKEMCDVSDRPLIVQPNAGLPKLVEGTSIYDLSPEKMANYVEDLVLSGANIVGGCCGTTPEHLKLMVEAASSIKPLQKKKISFSKLASRTTTFLIGEEFPTAVIGGYINPTGKKQLMKAIREGNTSVLCEEAVKQVNAGAHIIDVNLGLSAEEEKNFITRALTSIQRVIHQPLSIDTVNYDAMEEGLKVYDGKPLLNSTNGEDETLQRVIKLAKKYGAAVVGLTLEDKGIPEKAEDRFKIAEKIVTTAVNEGIRREDIYIDTLVLTAGAQQSLAMECLKAIRLVKKELGVKTLLGVENISHGLPNRRHLNDTFLAMALEAGLDIPILNPYHSSNWPIIRSSDVLMNKDKNAQFFIQWADKVPEAKSVAKTEEAKRVDEVTQLIEIILEGDQETVIPQVEVLLTNSISPEEIINRCVTPALEEAGENYEKQIYFLPQLLMAAETAQKVFQHLKPLLQQKEVDHIGTFVIATVKGDIHDIGKNIVSIMLQNHGYRVIDLGKDVEAEVIIETAIKEKADIIGLSALMTTTMQEMKSVMEILKARNLSIPVMVGGAVVTQHYAEMIDAHYAEDAIQAVRLARKLTKTLS
ncbi:homocysteine S-methyltransferase family protein [Clostridium formicaceticum]|uniref:Methionine synthase n=1 Tax=Clostridium formicaceticum TaxID=1497 RepID=A0AAC9RJ24_9CLOT|nr:homocysteine S-methyltransferase family protein [Clostridium formicaceticum]ARE86417.1 Methionine synthase [Clostridium formicaceticum]